MFLQIKTFFPNLFITQNSDFTRILITFIRTINAPSIYTNAKNGTHKCQKTMKSRIK